MKGSSSLIDSLDFPQISPKNVLEKEQKCVERLILGGSRHQYAKKETCLGSERSRAVRCF